MTANPALDAGHMLDLLRANVRVLDDVVVQHHDVAGRDRAHGEFLVPRHAEFSDEKHVQRRAEPPRHFVRHRHPAARQRENQEVIGVVVSRPRQRLAQPPAGVDAIRKSVPG